MAVVDIRTLVSLVPRDRRLIGLDVGSKTIGLALSDLSRMVATPHDVVRRTKFSKDAEHISRVIEENEVGGFVIGLPISMDGTEGRRCQSTRDFTNNLLKIIDLPAAFWDERLSTAVVERMMVSEMDMTRKRRAQIVDKLAAAYILQGALDAMPSGI
ncbi:MAG: Holliday junction resolvase RuvX [Rhodospirillales bacterium]|jgi:putative holliday junction resolvase|nr:Holliday junction resolvase RuvX [Rhodospirillales bacterium]